MPPFATPKPERLLQRILTIASNPGDLVLDSFAGSGTTGAVAHKIATGELRWDFERAARDLVVAPDGARAWAITTQGDVWPLDLTRGEEHERIWAPPGRVRAGLHTERSALSPDGRWLLPSCDEGHGGVSVIDLARGNATVLRAPGAGELLPVGTFTADARAVVLLGGARMGHTGRAAPALYRFSLPDGAPETIRALRFSRGATAAQVQVRRMPCAFGGPWVLFCSATGLLARLRTDDDQPATWVKASVGTWGAPVSDDAHALVMAARRTAVVTIAHASSSVTGVASVGETVTALTLMPDGRSALAGTASGRVLPMRLHDTGS